MPDEVQLNFNSLHAITETGQLWQLEPGEKSLPVVPPIEVAHPGMSTMTPDNKTLVSMSNSYVVVYRLNADATAFHFHGEVRFDDEAARRSAIANQPPFAT